MFVDRNFIRIAEGQIHFHEYGQNFKEKGKTLYMIHASPASSIMLVPLMKEIGKMRYVIAPDTLGFGDSAPPSQKTPNADDYAESVVRILDVLQIEKCDFYGSHTGAHIASELAINHPERVNRLVLDGIGMFSEEDKKDFLSNYAPEVYPDEFGRHLVWAWNFVRDQVLHFPYFRRTPEYRRNDESMPSAENINTGVLEVLKGLTTYHKGYRAAFRHPVRQRLPLITQKTLCGASDDDPLKEGVEEASSLIKNSSKTAFPSEKSKESISRKAELIIEFLDKN